MVDGMSPTSFGRWVRPRLESWGRLPMAGGIVPDMLSLSKERLVTRLLLTPQPTPGQSQQATPGARHPDSAAGLPKWAYMARRTFRSRLLHLEAETVSEVEEVVTSKRKKRMSLGIHIFA